MYDFIAIGGFSASIFLLYLSYSQFCRLSQTIGLSDSIKTIPYKSENITFVSYAANSLTTLTFGFIERQRQYLTNAIHDAVMETIPVFTSQTLDTCINKNEGILSGIVRTIIVPDSVNQCISKITQINIENIMHSQQQKIRILLVQLDTDISEIRSITAYALNMCYSSTAYLSWRILNRVESIRLLK